MARTSPDAAPASVRSALAIILLALTVEAMMLVIDEDARRALGVAPSLLLAWLLPALTTVVLVVFMARRHNWARLVYLVLSAVSLLSLPLGALVDPAAAERVRAPSSLILAACAVAAIILLLVPGSSGWFRGGHHRRNG